MYVKNRISGYLERYPEGKQISHPSAYVIVSSKKYFSFGLLKNSLYLTFFYRLGDL